MVGNQTRPERVWKGAEAKTRLKGKDKKAKSRCRRRGMQGRRDV